MQPSPVASNPSFPSQILSHSFGENLQAVRDKIRDGKLWFEATPRAEDKLSKSIRSSGWWDSVSSFDVATTTELLAKGGLLIPAISSSPPVSAAMITPGHSWAQYSFYKYIACTLQTTSKQVKIHNRLLRPCVSFLYAKCHSEMNATSAIIAARDLVQPPPWCDLSHLLSQMPITGVIDIGTLYWE